MSVFSEKNTYQVEDLVGETGVYRLYRCVKEDDGRQCLLMIATSLEHNDALERAALVLNELAAQADKLEAEYALIKKETQMMLNYGIGFPEVVESFACPGQMDRWVLILAFRKVIDPSQMLPLAKIIGTSRWVDTRTSVWILGKLLKILAFTQSVGVACVPPDTSNILIEPNEHYVLLFDWIGARMLPTVSDDVCQAEIVAATRAVVELLGGEDMLLAEDCPLEYRRLVMDLAHGKYRCAKSAHKQFYRVIDSLWSRGFYCFTTKNVEEV